MNRQPLSVWEKFDIEEYKLARQSSNPPISTAENNSAPNAIRSGLLGKKQFWVTLNSIATILWLYALLKIFVVDLDRVAMTKLSPSWLWLLDYRFFAPLFVATLLFVFFKWWDVIVILLYVGLFPLIVLVWWIPRLYYKRRSWDFLLGSLQIGWSLGQSIKFALLACTIFGLASFSIALDGPSSLLLVAVVALIVLWIWLISRAVIYAVAPSKFVVYQQNIIANILDSRVVGTMTALPVAAKSSEVSQLNDTQISQTISNASMGLAIYASSALWAAKLNQYRKSGISVLFSAFAVVALLAQGLVLFSIANMGIYRIDSSQFEYSQVPHLTTFARYSLSSMFVSEIDALRPMGTWASVVSLMANFSSGVIVLVMIVSVVFSLKQGRDDLVAQECINAMRGKADTFAEKLTGEYRLPLIDLLDRIAELNGIFSNWTRQIVHAVVIGNRRDGESSCRSWPSNSEE